MSVHSVLLAQYHAALQMLKQAIEKCPPEMWDDPQDRNRFWQVAYHALFYTLLYSHTSLQTFQAWPGHREAINRMGELPADSIAYTRAEILECWKHCREQIDTLLPQANLEGESGFHWLRFSKLEALIYNLRHLEQHTGELMERLGSRAQIEVDWQSSLP